MAGLRSILDKNNQPHKMQATINKTRTASGKQLETLEGNFDIIL